MAYSKFKALLKMAAVRTITDLQDAISHPVAHASRLPQLLRSGRIRFRMIGICSSWMLAARPILSSHVAPEARSPPTSRNSDPGFFHCPQN
jgi:hypothetical protein